MQNEKEAFKWTKEGVKSLKNIDNNWLEPGGNEQFTIGYVDEVNGAGGQEIPQFVPTRNELVELLKYWTRVSIDHRYLYFLYRQYCSSGSRRQDFAERRMARIEKLLGEEATKVIDGVIAEFGKTEDARLWNIFMNGTAEDWALVKQELEDFMKQLDERDDNNSEETKWTID